MKSMAGVSLVEVLVVLGLVSIGLLVAVPALAQLRDAGRAGAGARHMAGAFQEQRWKSVAQHKTRGFLFERIGSGWAWLEVEDGNGNGLRTSEVRRGTDRTLAGPNRLESLVERVTLGFPPGGPYPEVPPGTGTLSSTDDPIQFGRSDLVSFSPVGNSSSGTLYVTDGKEALYGVVLFGPSVRVRVWRYIPRERRWAL